MLRLVYVVLFIILVQARAFRVSLSARRGALIGPKHILTTALRLSESSTEGGLGESPVGSMSGENGEELDEESEEDKYKREKLAEIRELQAKEVFVERNTGRWECQACGFVYDEKDGYEKRGVPKGTQFAAVENFRCPQCGAGKKYFVEETETLSGFKENLKYGFGGNSLTAGQKSNLIYGGLAIGFAIFMSGYLLE